VAVAGAPRIEDRIRQKATELADELRLWHRLGTSAEQARFESTGHLGEPIWHSGFNASLLIGSRGPDDGGLRTILASRGLNDNLTPIRALLPPLTVQELLAMQLKDDEDNIAPEAAE
jgi:hypothetical protein